MLLWASSVCLGLSFFALASTIRSKPTANLLSRVGRLPASDVQLRHGFADTGFQRMANRIKQQLVPKRRLNQADLELPDFLDLLWVSICSGSALYSAFSQLQSRMTGILATELGQVLYALDHGSNLETEITALSDRLPSRQMQEFCHKLLWSFERGTPLVTVLADQAAACRGEMRNLLTRLAGRNETRMLVPLVFLILPVTVLFAVYPSLQLLNLNYI